MCEVWPEGSLHPVALKSLQTWFEMSYVRWLVINHTDGIILMVLLSSESTLFVQIMRSVEKIHRCVRWVHGCVVVSVYREAILMSFFMVIDLTQMSSNQCTCTQNIMETNIISDYIIMAESCRYLHRAHLSCFNIKKRYIERQWPGTLSTAQFSLIRIAVQHWVERVNGLFIEIEASLVSRQSVAMPIRCMLTLT